MTKIGPISTISAPAGDKSPDSVAQVGNTTFIEYGNGADSTGAGGSSQIVQYDAAGNVLNTYDLAGSVDGLKFNPVNDLLYALQNQDGNSLLTLINPRTGQVSAPMPYADASTTSGYDDIAFEHGKVFESYTNPTSGGDPVIVQLRGGNFPIGTQQTTPILNADAVGRNTVTGARGQAVPLSDPDSLKSAPNGDLLLTSGADGVIVDVRHPGQGNQQVSFTQVTDAAGNAASRLDDVIKPSASSGTFTLTDTSGNAVKTFHASHLNPDMYYASVDSLGGFGAVNSHTGVFHLLVASPGAHGLAFKPDANSVTFGGDPLSVHHDHGGLYPL